MAQEFTNTKECSSLSGGSIVNLTIPSSVFIIQLGEHISLGVSVTMGDNSASILWK